VSVPTDLVARTVQRFDVPDPGATTRAVTALLEALALEPDPHTTVIDPAEAIDVHVADSVAGLEVAALRQAAVIADVGAGAGFPGLILAAALPDARVDLIESSNRKTAVIDRLAAAAGLENRARAVPARAEEWAAGPGAGAYDAVTARALARLPVICEYAAPLLRLGGVLVAWKGARDPEEEQAGERAAAELGLSPPDVTASHPYRGSTNRHLYVYYKVTDTPDKYPRRAGVATKRPIR
jgi:16S rRNA (guanine527-N7)-methyltransferase